MNLISANGSLVPADQPILYSNNRGFRYAEGLFETIKIIKGKIPMADLHFDRLFSGIKLLDFKPMGDFNAKKLIPEIIALSELNKCSGLAKARLSVYNGDGELNDQRGNLHYIIECVPLPSSSNQLNEQGLKIHTFTGARKPMDLYANLKSSNFLVYSLASAHARANGFDDCVVLNTQDKIADATIANIFIIKSRTIITPPLAEGCVDGVMRRHIIENINSTEFELMERPIAIPDLESADEIFLTNAIYGLRWVGEFQQKKFKNPQSRDIYNQLVKTIWE
jgi:branched-chain amino acid aminotransferase